MRALLVLLAGLVCGCNLDVAERHYKTLAAAKGRTWLPEHVLPPSTRDIDEWNNVDLNDSEGKFRFSPADSAIFFAKLSPVLPKDTPYENWSGITGRFARQGRSAWFYRDSETHLVWVFFCVPTRDQCDFIGWTVRG